MHGSHLGLAYCALQYAEWEDHMTVQATLKQSF
jgi:hypothetical protein